MSPKPQEDRNFLNMAGELVVAAESNRRGILSAVTYRTAKSANPWAFASQRPRPSGASASGQV